MVPAAKCVFDYVTNTHFSRSNDQTMNLRHLTATVALVLACALLYPGSAHADNPPTWTRIAGATSLDTMNAAIDAGTFAKGSTVVLATVDGYWDALAAAGAAGLADAPIVMTDAKSLSDQAKQQLERLKPATIIVCGGTASVSDAVKSSATKAAEATTIERFSGNKAPDTAVDLFRKTPDLVGATWSNTAFVCTVHGYWDALAAAPVAYALHIPIFLTNDANALPQSALDAMKDTITSVYIVGGELSVPKAVESQLTKAGFTFAGRIAGTGSIETSMRVAQFGIEHGMSASTLGVATVNGFWDALAGAPLVGKSNGVMLLVDRRDSACIAGFTAPHEADISHAYVFGGTETINPRTFRALAESTGSSFPYVATPEELWAQMDIEQDFLPAHFLHGYKGREYQRYIVLHDTEGEGTPAGVVGGWEYNGNGVAAHFVVGKDGSIVQCVPLDQIAHHAGYGDIGNNNYYGVPEDGRDDRVGTEYNPWSADYGMNSWSVGIEMVHVGGSGYYPDAQLDAVDTLIAYIDAYFDFESPIIDHKSWRTGNSDTSPEFADYLYNYQNHRTHD